MEVIYLLREIKVDGATFTVYNTIRIDKIDKVTRFPDGEIKFIYGKLNGTNVCEENHNLYKLSLIPKGVNMNEVEFLPYFADVTEDLPSSCKFFPPKTYHNCQLTTQLPNGYKVFRNHETGEDLKIAIHSNTYSNGRVILTNS